MASARLVPRAATTAEVAMACPQLHFEIVRIGRTSCSIALEAEGSDLAEVNRPIKEAGSAWKKISRCVMYMCPHRDTIAKGTGGVVAEGVDAESGGIICMPKKQAGKSRMGGSS